MDRNSKRAVSGEWGEAGWGAGGCVGSIVGNCQSNGASGEGIGGAVGSFLGVGEGVERILRGWRRCSVEREDCLR